MDWIPTEDWRDEEEDEDDTFRKKKPLKKPSAVKVGDGDYEEDEDDDWDDDEEDYDDDWDDDEYQKVTTVGVKFPLLNGKFSNKTYSYRMFNRNYQVGDWVIVTVDGEDKVVLITCNGREYESEYEDDVLTPYRMNKANKEVKRLAKSFEIRRTKRRFGIKD